METIELSGVIGLIALVCLTANFLIGLLIWSAFQIKLPYKLTLLGLHKFTGYAAAIGIILHIGMIPLDPKSGFTWGDLVLPLWTEHQPLANVFGAVAFYIIAVVVVSSYYKEKISLKAWRFLHYSSYVAAIPLFIHSIITDPRLEDRPVDWFDGEKVLVELCVVGISGLMIYRFFVSKRNQDGGSLESQ